MLLLLRCEVGIIVTSSVTWAPPAHRANGQDAHHGSQHTRGAHMEQAERGRGAATLRRARAGNLRRFQWSSSWREGDAVSSSPPALAGAQYK